MCVKCHSYGTKEEQEKKGFVHTPVKNKNCLSCHKPHVSEEKSLLKIAENKLCLKCHFQINKNEKVHPPSQKGNCLICHFPHNSNFLAQLKKQEKFLCFKCHKKQEEESKYFSQHTPFASKECSVCHDSHSGKTRLLKKNG